MRNVIQISALALSLSLIAAAGANAQVMRTEKNMSLDLTNQLASAACGQ